MKQLPIFFTQLSQKYLQLLIINYAYEKQTLSLSNGSLINLVSYRINKDCL